MKICVMSNSLVNVILVLLYIESCRSFTIDRELRDISDSLDANNCNSIVQSYVVGGRRCRCDGISSSIVSTDTGLIHCIKNKDIDISKYTGTLLYSLLFSSLKM